MTSLPAGSGNKTDDTPQYRPAYHFSPAFNWMNDPNGLVYDDGVYHLFFQHYPDGLTWGPMHWGHATSPDLLHWDEQPIALYPDRLGMIFSGSVVIDRDNTSGLGKDGSSPWVALFTHHDMDAEKAGSNRYQSQSIAYSLDKGASWTKYAGNPVLPNPGIKNFRDPKVLWHGATGRWIMALGGGDRIYFYSSPDLKTWAQESELISFEVVEGNVLECPDLVSFDVDGQTKWVLLISVYTGAPNGGSGTRYLVGDFDGKYFVPEHRDARWLDHGPDNYAGVTFHNRGDQRLLIGWMSNWVYAQKVPTAPWRSAMTLPRELRLERVGDRLLLAQNVVADFGEKSVAEWNQGTQDITAEGSVKLSLKASNLLAFTFTLSNDAGDCLLIGYDQSSQCYFIDRTNAGLSDFSEAFSMRATAPRLALSERTDVALYLDRSSVELFADAGLSMLTSLIFPRSPYTNFILETMGAVEQGEVAVTAP
jgi:fructan beta-fructosidase